MSCNFAVLASGKGSNLQAIIDELEQGNIQGHLSVVVSDNASAGALQRAELHGIDNRCIAPENYAQKSDYEKDLADFLEEKRIGLVVLAGFMRVLSGELLGRFPARVMNIHPSLLPAFPGLDAVEQAWEYGVKITGCTVHIVEEEVDAGPIILQEAVPVLAEDDVNSLQQRVHAAEHRCYPRAVDMFCKGEITVKGRRCYLYDKSVR